MKLTILKPRLTTIVTQRIPTQAPGSWRTSDMSSADRGYGYKWQKAREGHLRNHPLCVMCEAESPPKVTVATVVDHMDPHRGDMAIFWDSSRWQSLCAHHHSSDKQRQEQQEALK